MPRLPTLLLLALAAAGCAPTRPPAPVESPLPAVVTLIETEGPAEAMAAGRWIAVDVAGDEEQTRDIRRGVLEKTLVVNPGGHVLLRGVDHADGGSTVAFSGTLVGRVLTLEGVPGAAILAHEGTGLLLIDPSGRQTRFIRAAN